MKYFYLIGDINKDLFGSFLSFCNNNPDDKWTIIIDSGGGGVGETESMIKIINDRCDSVEVIFQAGYSAAFILFYKLKCKKYLCTEATGMFHHITINILMDSRGMIPYSSDTNTKKKYQETSKLKIEKFVNKFMNRKELSKFKKGEDVYFTFKRLTEIFPNVEVINGGEW